MNQAQLFSPPTIEPKQAPIISWTEPEDDDVPFRFEDDDDEPATGVAYTVRLADCPYPDANVVKTAVERFRRELDRQLAGDVLQVMRAFQNASESGESDLSKAEIAQAKRWAKAYDAARTAGFRDLGDVDEAYFEVKPA